MSQQAQASRQQTLARMVTRPTSGRHGWLSPLGVIAHGVHGMICSFLLKLKSSVSATTQRIFAVPDAHARQHGWQVTATHGGFGRRYRDPRFDYLASCATCNGRGGNPQGTTCSACHGTGRIVLDPAAVSRPGRGQP
jgi:hypothetical protein